MARHGLCHPISWIEERPYQYTIKINSLDTLEQQKITLMHETIHVVNNHTGLELRGSLQYTEADVETAVESQAKKFCSGRAGFHTRI